MGIDHETVVIFSFSASICEGFLQSGL